MERCEDGRCRAGDPVECQDGLSCSEEEGRARCEFAAPGPWLTFYGIASSAVSSLALYGVSTAHPTMPAVELSAAAIDGELQVAWDHRWSSDGAHLLLNVAGDRRALYGIDFGSGLPSAAYLIPNLPQDEGQYSLGDFDPNFPCATAQERGLLVAICWEESGPVATLASDAVEEDLSLDGARLCADGRTLVVPPYGFSLDDPSAAIASLSGFSVSPDGLTMIRHDDPDGDGSGPPRLEVRDCALDATSRYIELPDVTAGEGREAWWTPDSRHALVRIGAYPASQLLLVDTEAGSQGTAVKWHRGPTDSVTYEASFAQRSPYLLVQDGAAFSVVSFESGEESALQLPSGASEVSWTDDGETLEARRVLENGAVSAAWLQGPLEAPRLVFETTSTDVGLALSTRAGFALSFTTSDTPLFTLFDLEDLASGPREVAEQWSIGAITTPDIAPDGSGALITSAGDSGDTLLWLRLRDAQEGDFVRLTEGNSLFGSFQPWP